MKWPMVAVLDLRTGKPIPLLAEIQGRNKRLCNTDEMEAFIVARRQSGARDYGPFTIHTMQGPVVVWQEGGLTWRADQLTAGTISSAYWEDLDPVPAEGAPSGPFASWGHAAWARLRAECDRRPLAQCTHAFLRPLLWLMENCEVVYID